MSIVPADMPHAVAAFMRRVEKTLKPGQPSFCLVVAADDGEPFILVNENRTGLVVAATTLLFEAVQQEREGKCICETCDDWTARAKAALIAMGHDLPAAN